MVQLKGIHMGSYIAIEHIRLSQLLSACVCVCKGNVRIYPLKLNRKLGSDMGIQTLMTK